MSVFETIFSHPMGTINLSKKILEFIGILQSIDSKLNKLIQCELSSGIDTLNMAARASSEESRNKFLWNALDRFISAKQLEEHERLCIAFLGIIFCLNCLGERENSIYNLREFAYTNFGFNDWEQVKKLLKKEGLTLFVKTAFNPPYLIQYYLLNPIIWRKEIFQEILQLSDNIKEYRGLREIKYTANLNTINFRIQYGEKQLKKIEKIINKLKTQRVNDPDITLYEHDIEVLTNKLKILYLRKGAFEYLEKLEKESPQIQSNDFIDLT